MICKKCKQEIPDNAVICRNCGEIIEENMEKKVKEKEQEIQAMEEKEQNDISIEDLLNEPLPTEFKVSEPVRYRDSKQYQERKQQVRKTIIMTAGMLAATIAVGIGTVFLVRNVVLKPDPSNQTVKVNQGGNVVTPGEAAVKNDTEKETETNKESETKKETEKKQVGSVSIQASAKQKGETEKVSPVTVRKTEKETEGTVSSVKVQKTGKETEKTVAPVKISKTEKETENIPPVTIKKETEAPETEAPETNPPETNPPETNPPETNPPETNPPETNPPETNPPETNPPETNPPETNPPETNPPETDPPETEPVDDGYEDGWGEEEEPIYNGGGYILPNSSSELLTRDSLVGLNGGDLLLARNEIFARHGRMFDDEWLQSYFDSQPWYQPIYSPSEFSYDLLSSIEMANINTILAYEAEIGA